MSGSAASSAESRPIQRPARSHPLLKGSHLAPAHRALPAVGALHLVASCCRLLPVAEPADRGALAAPPWDILMARTPTAAAATARGSPRSPGRRGRGYGRRASAGRRRRVAPRAHDRGRGYRRYRRCCRGGACLRGGGAAGRQARPAPRPLLTKVVRAAPPLPQTPRARELPAESQRELPGGLHLHFHGVKAEVIAAILVRERCGIG